MPDVHIDAKSGQLPDYEVKQLQEERIPDVDMKVTPGRLPDFDAGGSNINVGAKTNRTARHAYSLESFEGFRRRSGPLAATVPFNQSLDS